MNGPRRGIFNPTAACNTDQIILVEGVIDSAALCSININNSIPTYGVNGLTDELLSHLKECRICEAVLLMDNDEAGHKANDRLAEKLNEYNITVITVALLAKDPAEFVSAGGTTQQLRALINSINSITSIDPINSINPIKPA